MAKFEFRSGGRRVSQRDFFENLQRQAMNIALKEMEERARGAAASVVDPATGKHAEVFVYKTGETTLSVRTKGSPAFARELERRLDLRFGAVQSLDVPIAEDAPLVYLAHASEDQDSLARPLAETFLANGINVWLDEWEIQAGDSLRRKMEEGLKGCTHFVVLLTPRSLGKPWVETEIDAGFVRSVQGSSRFIGLRVGLRVEQLSVYLQTMLCPELAPNDEEAVERLISDIHGVSRKPSLGPAPQYVRSLPDGLAGWSRAAIGVAEHILRAGENGAAPEPQLDYSEIAAATGLSNEDVRLGALDLSDAGLVEVRQWGEDSDVVWPRGGLFVEFNKPVFGFDTQADAATLARLLVVKEADEADVEALASSFPDWPVRRFNGALQYLDAANLVESLTGGDEGPYALVCLYVTDRTRRFARDHPQT